MMLSYTYYSTIPADALCKGCIRMILWKAQGAPGDKKKSQNFCELARLDNQTQGMNVVYA